MNPLLKLMMTPRGLAFDCWCVRRTGISPLTHLFARMAGYKPYAPAVCLMTRGRRSGAMRAVALPSYVLGGQVYVVGSKGGAPTDPFWVSNLRACADVVVYLRRRRNPVRARVVEGAERGPLWDQLVTMVPQYAAYQDMTSRPIPVVLLEGLKP
ncbi:MAG: nitroreductase family deazaflavin-dependent oxidoreductase [Proteobacteria bacterium]|nr:nitroreductase family deazaflavin-dependent oxidoreductase [Pseudomonadota bacterium]HQR03408.1 nitroreductase/quinone reductase family protein [Rhodocyclaceae bacterium]